MWKVTLKGLRAHWVRLALTGLAVVLGVGFVVGTFVLTDTMTRVFDDLVRGGTGSIDVYVRAASGDEVVGTESSYYAATPVPEDVLDTVLTVDGVETAAGGVEGFAQIVTSGGEAITPMGPPTLGASWTEPPLGGRVLREGGRAPTSANEVVIDARTADRYGLDVGERVEILFAGVDPRTFTITGISSAEGGQDNLAGATLAEFELETAQVVLGRQGEFTAISIDAATDVAAEELVPRLEAVLPAGLEALTVTELQDELMAMIDDALGFFTVALGIFGAVALFVGAFIIANTFSIVVVQRTRELALLRALGAGRRQIITILVAEASLVGVVASAVGVLAGLGLAAGLYALLAAFGMDMPTGGLVLLVRTVVIAFVIGMTVTVLSALMPARRAARIHPMEALRETSITPAYRPTPLRLGLGVAAAIAAVSLAGYAAASNPSNGSVLVGVGAALAVTAALVVGPVLTRPLIRLASGSGRHLTTTGRLARGNVMRTPRRSWATASALMVGLALVSFVAVLGSSLKVSATDAMERILAADLIVTSGNAMMGGVVPAVIGDQLADAPHVAAVSPMRIGAASVERERAVLTAIRPDAWDAVASTTVVEGALTGLSEPDTVMVDGDLAAGAGYEVGDEVAASFPATGTTRLRIAAIFEPDQLLSGWVVSTTTYDAHFPQPLDMAVLVARAEGSTIDQLRATVEEATTAYPTLQIQDQAEYRDNVAGQIDQLLALITALLGMALLIAVLGITNTLALSVHERTREIGLLRAVGMTRGQVRSMVRWEAVGIALLGSVVGLLLGTAFGWATVRTLADEGVTGFVAPVPRLLTYLAVAVLAGVVAALLPARRAARLDVLQAVTVE